MTGNRRSVVTIGTFDGVHLGHRRLIGHAIAEAQSREMRSVVVTFDRHPSETVRPESMRTKLITDLALKIELIEQCGVDEVVVLEFNAERAHQSPEAFAEELVTELEAAVILVGENFRFGHHHRGDVPLLTEIGARLGFSTLGIALVADDASRAVVSSRAIRSFIADGALSDVARLLGRAYELRGEWSRSSGAGVITPRDDLCHPPKGEYQVTLRLPGQAPAAPILDVRVDDRGTLALTGVIPGTALADGDLVGAVFSPNSE